MLINIIICTNRTIGLVFVSLLNVYLFSFYLLPLRLSGGLPDSHLFLIFSLQHVPARAAVISHIVADWFALLTCQSSPACPPSTTPELLELSEINASYDSAFFFFL